MDAKTNTTFGMGEITKVKKNSQDLFFSKKLEDFENH